ncbi:FixH family protein [Bacillus sp. FJAT-27251]|uniref:FixH family protein n=1 Tax=Bacillus sp. FJAT-27251 TaxID=1684142 RepID=UPI0006A7ABD8|nr:FixH family protein [Bacillus sp. FJAT-27251]
MKKIIVFIAIFLMALLAACGNEEDAAPKKEPANEVPDESPATEDSGNGEEHDNHEEGAHEDHEEPGESDGGHGHAGHSHDGDVIIDLLSGYDIKVKENAELAILVEEKGEPVTGAAVTFDIWAEGQEEHDTIQSKEAGNGVYKASRVFETAGMHKINVLVKNDHLEEEQLFTVFVSE